MKQGSELQYCFHDSNNNWDNNNGQNYISQISKEEKIEEVKKESSKIKEQKEEKTSETLLKFEPIVESEKEIDLGIETKSEPSEAAQFKPVTFSSEVIDINIPEKENKQEIAKSNNIIVPKEIKLSECRKLDDTEKISIPQKTVINSVKIETTVGLDHVNIGQNVISFESLKGKKENFQKAFDENQVTAGSVYVSSLIEDYQQKLVKEPKTKEPPQFIEDITISSKSLVPVKEAKIAEKGVSGIYLFKKRVKLALFKFIKLIKTALNYNEDKA